MVVDLDFSVVAEGYASVFEAESFGAWCAAGTEDHDVCCHLTGWIAVACLKLDDAVGSLAPRLDGGGGQPDVDAGLLQVLVGKFPHPGPFAVQ